MSSGIGISPQIWNWYAAFFVSMGMVIAMAIAFTFAVLTIHQLYLCSRNLTSKPTPSSLNKVFLHLSVFQALAVGAILVPSGSITVYYLLFFIIWKLAPGSIDAAPLEFNSLSDDEWFSSFSSLFIYLIALTVIIAGIIFLLFRRYANRINPDDFSLGFSKRFFRRYFHESLLVGFLLVLAACPVITYFFYNLSWLVMIIVPASSHELPKIALPNAQKLYFIGLEFLSYWLLVILFIPAVGLLLRGMLLRWRYTIENPALKLIFIRSVKFSIIGLLGWLGCFCMYCLSDALFKVILKITYR
jgi:hypothetical protein